MRRVHRWVVALAVALLTSAVAGPRSGAEGAPPPDGERPITVTPLTSETGWPLDSTDLELNERGQIASMLYSVDPLDAIHVLWHRGRATRISPDSPDVRYVRVTDLSDGGHVVGGYRQPTAPEGRYPF
jgi:hypothetical protein